MIYITYSDEKRKKKSGLDLRMMDLQVKEGRKGERMTEKEKEEVVGLHKWKNYIEEKNTQDRKMLEKTNQPRVIGNSDPLCLFLQRVA